MRKAAVVAAVAVFAVVAAAVLWVGAGPGASDTDARNGQVPCGEADRAWPCEDGLHSALFNQTLTFERCSGAIVGQVFEYEAIADRLPPGFEPQTVSANTQAPEALAALMTYDCSGPHGDPWAFSAVFAVVRITDDEMRPDRPASVDYYILELHSTNASLSDALASYGLPALHSRISLDIPELPPGTMGTAIHREDGLWYRAQAPRVLDDGLAGNIESVFRFHHFDGEHHVWVDFRNENRGALTQTPAELEIHAGILVELEPHAYPTPWMFQHSPVDSRNVAPSFTFHKKPMQ